MSSVSSDVTRTPTQYLNRERQPSSGSSSGAGNLPASPSDILLSRYAGWLSLLRSLISQFDDQASLEKTMAQTHAKVVKDWTAHPIRDIEVAFASGIRLTDSPPSSPVSRTGSVSSHSIGGSKIYELTKHIRDANSKQSTDHEAIHKLLHSQTVPALKALEKDVHKHMDVMLQEEKKRRKEKEKDEHKLRHLVKDLQKALSSAHGTSETAAFQVGDPWLVNIAIQHHLSEANLKYRNRSSTLEGIEQTFGVWEKSLINNLKSALLAYTSVDPTVLMATGTPTAELHKAILAIDADAEWNAYRDAQLSRSVSETSVDAFLHDYPGATDPVLAVVREGPLQRKSKILKHWNEKWYILTAAGWLHEFDKRPRYDVLDISNVDPSAPAPENLESVAQNQTLPPRSGSVQGLHMAGNTSSSGVSPNPSKSLWLKHCVLTEMGLGGSVPSSEFHIHHTDPRPLRKTHHTYKLSTNSVSESSNWYNALLPFAQKSLPDEAPNTPTTPVVAAAPATAAPHADQSTANNKRLSVASTASSVSDSGVTPAAPVVAAPAIPNPSPAHEKLDHAPTIPKLGFEDQKQKDEGLYPSLPRYSTTTGGNDVVTPGVASSAEGPSVGSSSEGRQPLAA